jgi:multicomponent Na+:H+ antiporter subunit G
VRYRDVLQRLHALAKASTLGILLVLAGAAINLDDLNDITSVVPAGVLQLLTSPPAYNMVSWAAYLTEGLPEEAVDEPRRRRIFRAARVSEKQNVLVQSLQTGAAPARKDLK